MEVCIVATAAHLDETQDFVEVHGLVNDWDVDAVSELFGSLMWVLSLACHDKTIDILVVRWILIHVVKHLKFVIVVFNHVS